MKQLGILTAVVVVAVGACQRPISETSSPAEDTAMADEPKPRPETVPDVAPEIKDVPPALAELAKERAKLHKRQTGALLTIQARSGTFHGTEPSIQINWSIDYTGPRHPFTILPPSLSPPESRHTTLRGWYIGLNGKPVTFMRSSGNTIGLPSPRTKDWYATSQGGKPVTGEPITLAWNGLSRIADRAFTPGETVLFQLEHAPTDRGDSDLWSSGAWTLDAWTGHLWSQPVILSCP